MWELCQYHSVCPVTSDHIITGTKSHTFPMPPSWGAPPTTSVVVGWEKWPAVTAYPEWRGEERMKINNKTRKKKEKSKRKKTEKQLSNLGCPHQVSLLHLNCTSQYHKTILCRIHQYSVPEQKATGNGSTASGTVTKVNRKKDVGTVSKKHAEVHAKQLQRTV